MSNQIPNRAGITEAGRSLHEHITRVRRTDCAAEVEPRFPDEAAVGL